MSFRRGHVKPSSNSRKASDMRLCTYGREISKGESWMLTLHLDAIWFGSTIAFVSLYDIPAATFPPTAPAEKHGMSLPENAACLSGLQKTHRICAAPLFPCGSHREPGTQPLRKVKLPQGPLLIPLPRLCGHVKLGDELLHSKNQEENGCRARWDRAAHQACCIFSYLGLVFIQN